MNSRTLFLLLSLLLLPLSLMGAEPPRPLGHVNDYANLLSRYEQHQMEGELRILSKQSGHEIAIVTLQSLEGQTVESKSREIFDIWKIGKKGKDNGLLLLISMQEREIRIETGYGTESLLPDAAAGRIIRHTIGPHLKNQEYYKGISEGIYLIQKHLIQDKPAHKNTEELSEKQLASATVLVLLTLILVPLLALAFGPNDWWISFIT
ncbi:MAG: hypothetical protein ACI8RA_002567, partial [Chlamydiales bacterium]